MASKHEQNRAEKRERLLRAAVDAFTEAGFVNTTVSDIVHRSDLTPSTFYNYYRDKDALREEMLSIEAGRMVAALESIRASASGIDDYFSQACRGLFESIVRNEQTATLLRRNLPLLRTLLDDKALQPVYSALRADVETAAQKGQLDSVDAAYADAVLRAATVEIAVVLLTSPKPNVDAAVSFLTRVLAAAFGIR